MCGPQFLVSGQFQVTLRFMLAGAPLAGAPLPVSFVEVPGQVDQRQQVADTDCNKSDGEQHANVEYTAFVGHDHLRCVRLHTSPCFAMGKAGATFHWW